MAVSKPKTITLAFDDDCFIVDDQPAASRNLDGIFIDLTDDATMDELTDATNPSTKTIEFNMDIGECFSIDKISATSSPLIDISNKYDANNNQPCCSKWLTPEPKASTVLIENREEFVCSLCLCFIVPKLGVTLRTCQHNFCKKCLIESIYNKHDPQSGEVACPLEIENCNKKLTVNEVKELLGTEYDVFQEQIQYNKECAEEVERRKKEELEKDSGLVSVLINMNDLPIIPNVIAFECAICFVQIPVGQGIMLQNCLHNFCRECICGCIEASDEYQVKCPFIENEFPCKEFLRDSEIRGLISKEVFDKHLEKSLKIAENANELTFHCRTPDCPSFVEVLQEEIPIINFQCQACHKVNCIPCKAIHEGKSCQEYQEEVNPELKTQRRNNEEFMTEAAIKKLIDERSAMYCPRCNIPVMKIAGCDFIVCTACKLGICWVTRKPRNDLIKANGQIIKGCGCN